MPNYARPPLVERVIEFRTERDGGLEVIERLTSRLKTNYPLYDDQKMLEFIPIVGGRVENRGEVFMQRTLKNPESTEICILKTNAIAVTRQAPYTGWEELRDRAERAWRVWNKEMNHPRLGRLGSRVTNRIDIPAEEAIQSNPQNYVNIGFGPLPFDGDVKGFNVLRNGRVRDRYDFQLMCHTTPSPLIDHISIILDFDFGLVVDLPSSWHDIEAEMVTMRDMLHSAFESSITDPARKLFQQ